MNKSAVAERLAPEDMAPRKVPEIDPACVEPDVIGNKLRSFVARLPQDFVASDLAEPTLFRRVQLRGERSALRKMDRVVMVAWDEGHVWEAWVSQAGPDFVVLSRPSHYELQARRTEYFSDDLYKVTWSGAYFNVIRKSDKHVMSAGHGSENIAIRELKNLYPRPL